MKLVQQSLGAQVLFAQWPDSNRPLLYLSPMMIEGLPRRGGVPILFPQFADRGALPKHGFARNASWQCVDEVQGESLSKSHYHLNITPHLLSDWPYHASLDLWVSLTDTELSLHLQIVNCGKDSFTWTGGFHPYWSVDDLLDTQITGLQNIPCEDRYAPECKLDQSPKLTFTGAMVERLYLAAPSLELINRERSLLLECEGFSQWMVWNPGAQGERDFADLPPGDWRHFVCIEPVIASTENHLLPGQIFTGKLRATIKQSA
jgi:glucose-6-phosphate 1-epimerase